jgi:hypothetical protein
VITLNVSPGAANLVLALMDAVLTDVYQSPAQVARAKAARERRQAAIDALATASAQGKDLPSGDLLLQMRAALLQLQNVSPDAPSGYHHAPHLPPGTDSS